MLGFPLLYFKGMRLMMLQLSSFYCRGVGEPLGISGFAWIEVWALRGRARRSRAYRVWGLGV